MKNFKFLRTGSLVLGLWLLFASVYIVCIKLEKPYVCSEAPEGYGVYTYVQFMIERDRVLQLNSCDVRNMPTTFWIVPADLILGGLAFLGVFGYLQFGRTVKR